MKFLTAPLLYNLGFFYLMIAVSLLGFVAFKPMWFANNFFKQETDWRVSYDINEKGTTINWFDVDEPIHKWSEYKHLYQTKNLILLNGEEEDCFQIVPKRAFANQAEIEQFRAWASGIGQKEMPLVAPIPEP